MHLLFNLLFNPVGSLDIIYIYMWTKHDTLHRDQLRRVVPTARSQGKSRSSYQPHTTDHRRHASVLIAQKNRAWRAPQGGVEIRNLKLDHTKRGLPPPRTGQSLAGYSHTHTHMAPSKVRPVLLFLRHRRGGASVPYYGR